MINSGACTLSAQQLTSPVSKDAMVAELGAGRDDEAQLFRTMRRLRQDVMAHLIVRDLGGLAPLQEVLVTISTLAEETLRQAQRFYADALRATYGVPRNAAGNVQQLHIVAMGKLGGHELNVSSDIDLIFVYPEEGKTDGKREIDNHDYFNRLARKIVAMISNYTEDGYVFRVDTRLRPYGDSGPLVVSFDMLEEYFYAQGRE